jgi:hypothetical protein
VREENRDVAVPTKFPQNVRTMPHGGQRLVGPRQRGVRGGDRTSFRRAGFDGRPEQLDGSGHIGERSVHGQEPLERASNAAEPGRLK